MMWVFEVVGWSFLAGLCVATFISPIVILLWAFSSPPQEPKE